KFLHQAVLICAITPFNTAFSLRGAGFNDSDSQLLASSAKLGQSFLAGQLCFQFGLLVSHIDVLAICVKRRRNPVLVYPQPQQFHGSNRGLLTVHQRAGRAGGVVSHIHHAGGVCPTLDPVVMCPIHLDQFTKVRFPFSPRSMTRSLPTPLPYSFFNQPAPRRLPSYRVTRLYQLFHRQRRPKVVVMFSV